MPAWIHPIRLTTIADAHARLLSVCVHLEQHCRTCSDALSVTVAAYAGIESGPLDRGEVERCCAHARLLAAAVEWLSNDDAKRGAIVIECHSAQSSGGADLLLLNGDTAYLFEAGAGEGDVKGKHKADVKVLNRESRSLLRGKVVTAVEQFRVVKASVRDQLPLNARDAVIATVGNAVIIRC